MKFMLLCFIISTCALAQDICAPKIEPKECQNRIKNLIFNKDSAGLKKLISQHGLKILFENKGIRGAYGHTLLASYIKDLEFFKIIEKDSGYPSEIPDHQRFLESVIGDIKFRDKNPELIKILFFNSEKEKNIFW